MIAVIISGAPASTGKAAGVTAEVQDIVGATAEFAAAMEAELPLQVAPVTGVPQSSAPAFPMLTALSDFTAVIPGMPEFEGVMPEMVTQSAAIEGLVPTETVVLPRQDQIRLPDDHPGSDAIRQHPDSAIGSLPQLPPLAPQTPVTDQLAWTVPVDPTPDVLRDRATEPDKTLSPALAVEVHGIAVLPVAVPPVPPVAQKPPAPVDARADLPSEGARADETLAFRRRSQHANAATGQEGNTKATGWQVLAAPKPLTDSPPHIPASQPEAPASGPVFASVLPPPPDAPVSKAPVMAGTVLHDPAVPMAPVRAEVAASTKAEITRPTTDLPITVASRAVDLSPASTARQAQAPMARPAQQGAPDEASVPAYSDKADRTPIPRNSFSPRPDRVTHAPMGEKAADPARAPASPIGTAVAGRPLVPLTQPPAGAVVSSVDIPMPQEADASRPGPEVAPIPVARPVKADHPPVSTPRAAGIATGPMGELNLAPLMQYIPGGHSASRVYEDISVRTPHELAQPVRAPEIPQFGSRSVLDAAPSPALASAFAPQLPIRRPAADSVAIVPGTIAQDYRLFWATLPRQGSSPVVDPLTGLTAGLPAGRDDLQDRSKPAPTMPWPVPAPDVQGRRPAWSYIPWSFRAVAARPDPAPVTMPDAATTEGPVSTPVVAPAAMPGPARIGGTAPDQTANMAKRHVALPGFGRLAETAPDSSTPIPNHAGMPDAPLSRALPVTSPGRSKADEPSPVGVLPQVNAPLMTADATAVVTKPRLTPVTAAPEGMAVTAGAGQPLPDTAETSPDGGNRAVRLAEGPAASGTVGWPAALPAGPGVVARQNLPQQTATGQLPKAAAEAPTLRNTPLMQAEIGQNAIVPDTKKMPARAIIARNLSVPETAASVPDQVFRQAGPDRVDPARDRSAINRPEMRDGAPPKSAPPDAPPVAAPTRLDLSPPSPMTNLSPPPLPVRLGVAPSLSLRPDVGSLQSDATMGEAMAQEGHRLPRHLPTSLARAATKAEEEGRLELVLDPAELGRVRFELSSSSTDRVQVNVVVERPETLELLRRNIDHLRAEFREAGFDASTLSFSQWGRGHDAPPEPGATPSDLITDPEGNASPAPQSAPRNTSRDGLDLRL